MIQLLWKALWYFLKVLNVILPCDPAIPLLGVYPREMKTHIHTKTYKQISTAALFLIVPNYQQFNDHQLVNEISKKWYILMEYYLTTKRKEILIQHGRN